MFGFRIKKVVRFSAVAGFLISILLLLAISAGSKQVASTSPGHVLSNRPPVIVVGGSLYGDSGGEWANFQSTDGRTDEYYVTVIGNKNVLLWENYKHSVDQNVDSSQSWKIVVFDRDIHGYANLKQGIEVCSNSSCDPTVAPQGSDSHVIYIRLYDSDSTKSIWENNNKPNDDGNLYFKDQSDDQCKTSYGHDGTKHDRHGGKCERPSVARLFIGSATPKKYRCKAKEGLGCRINVGEPQPMGQK